MASGRRSRSLRLLVRDHGLKIKALKNLWRLFPKHQFEFCSFEAELMKKIYR